MKEKINSYISFDEIETNLMKVKDTKKTKYKYADEYLLDLVKILSGKNLNLVVEKLLNHQDLLFKAKIITAIEDDVSEQKSFKVFLAGGVTNCPNWQKELIYLIKNKGNLTVFNPRRENFSIDDPNASEQQIAWEYKHLKEADLIVFWFSERSLNPIVLYELGKWGNSSDKPIIIGMDKGYERRQDVIIQTKLAKDKDSVTFVNSLEEMAYSIKLKCSAFEEKEKINETIY